MQSSGKEFIKNREKVKTRKKQKIEWKIVNNQSCNKIVYTWNGWWMNYNRMWWNLFSSNYIEIKLIKCCNLRSYKLVLECSILFIFFDFLFLPRFYFFPIFDELLAWRLQWNYFIKIFDTDLFTNFFLFCCLKITTSLARTARVAGQPRPTASEANSRFILQSLITLCTICSLSAIDGAGFWDCLSPNWRSTHPHYSAGAAHQADKCSWPWLRPGSPTITP